jgi:hypothetical protein
MASHQPKSAILEANSSEIGFPRVTVKRPVVPELGTFSSSQANLMFDTSNVGCARGLMDENLLALPYRFLTQQRLARIASLPRTWHDHHTLPLAATTKGDMYE